MTKGSGREMTNADTALGAEVRVRFHMDDNDLRAGIPANVPTLRGYTVGNSSTGLKPRRPLAQLGRAVALHAGGRRFESCAAPPSWTFKILPHRFSRAKRELK